MARRRFFVEQVRGGRAILWGADARHLACVLRAEAGRRFEISDNRRVYLAEITAVEPSQVVFRVLEELAAAPPPGPRYRWAR